MEKTEISLTDSFELNIEILSCFRDNLYYSPWAKKKGIQGLVITKFEANENGEIIYCSIIKGTNILLDKEVIRIVRKLKESKIKLKYQKYIFPVRFKL
jgi:TonB family protein